MCGIAGIASFSDEVRPTAAQVRAMCDTLIHRGPDDWGMDLQQGVGLGMRRLSIIDLSGGHQPIFNEDRSVRVVFNGEIYNYRELRRELEAKGHRFATHSDTEVIVHLWEESGPGFADRLNGMFAIALHDLKQRKLVLARDHVGIKPLYYAADRKRIVFGSEIKALLASGEVPRELDVDALGQFLAWEYVPGEGTLLKAVRKLEPACLMEVDLDSGQRQITRFWDVGQADHNPRESAHSDARWLELVEDKIRQCVQRQLVSDVPLGAFLSGGVDSSLVVAGMGQARTFSIGFADPTYNEAGWAEKVARHLGTEHHCAQIEPKVVELFDPLMNLMDDPIGDFSIFPTFLVSRYARQEVTVALSGDGGDELFGGYETYLAQDKSHRWQRVPAFLRSGLAEPAIRALRPSAKKKGLVNKAKRFVEGLEHSPTLGHARWRLFVGRAMRQSLFSPQALGQMPTPVEAHIQALAQRAGDRNEMDRALYIDFHSYLVDNCLVKVDRMSMATSLESRVPLLDKELVELAFRLPSRLKVHQGKTKVLLKQAAARQVPAECIYRPKEGFSIPMKNWLRGEFAPLLRELLDPRHIAAEGIFNAQTVAQLQDEHLREKANHSHILWSLIVFEDWRRRWKV
ncbi:MAG: asparagine synthase (glutamine-hydrolyzing) [Phycisphaeraceae bacterium]|nr:asparagine synthase (glutamine-hydrolyzing) [Phycisphaeraceae bacterium]